MTSRLVLALAAGLTCACSLDPTPATGGPPLDVPEGCNPLAADWSCLLPFPSDQFRVEDESMPSGFRVELTDAATPRDKDGAPIDLTLLHPADGFSPGSQILAYFPTGIDDADLVFHTAPIDASTGPESTSILLDAESGERVPHFAETDPRPTDDSERGLILRPLVRLQDSHRYIVALRNLHDPSGASIEPPEGFRRIRDRETLGDPVLGPIAKRWEEELFPALEAADVAREDLVLAWDFTTRSEQNATGDMLDVRADVLAKIAKAPLQYQIVKVDDAVSAHIWRRVEASVKVPLYLDADAPYAALHRGSDGKVSPNGEIDVPFTVLIPPSVGNRPAGSPPARLLQFGHGFFGTRAEAEGVVAQTADEKGFVVVATDWVGMSDQDRIPVADALLSDTNHLMRFTDRVHQAMANFIAVGAVAQGALANAPELSTPAGAAYDPAALYFYGLSMGHILGSTYVALSPSIERATLGVGGNDFSFIMFRAQPFTFFLVLMASELPNPLDQLAVSFMTQLSFDRIDPGTFAPHLLADTLDGSPAKREVLLQIGIGDPAVNPLAAEWQARTLGIPSLAPAPRVIAGVEAVSGPIDGSAINEFDFHIDPEPGFFAIPPKASNEVHEGVRNLAAAKEQLSRFLKPNGKIEQTCDGACDPE